MICLINFILPLLQEVNLICLLMNHSVRNEEWFVYILTYFLVNHHLICLYIYILSPPTRFLNVTAIIAIHFILLVTLSAKNSNDIGMQWIEVLRGKNLHTHITVNIVSLYCHAWCPFILVKLFIPFLSCDHNHVKVFE